MKLCETRTCYSFYEWLQCYLNEGKKCMVRSKHGISNKTRHQHTYSKKHSTIMFSIASIICWRCCGTSSAVKFRSAAGKFGWIDNEKDQNSFKTMIANIQVLLCVLIPSSLTDSAWTSTWAYRIPYVYSTLLLSPNTRLCYSLCIALLVYCVLTISLIIWSCK